VQVFFRVYHRIERFLHGIKTNDLQNIWQKISHELSGEHG
jgi:hypothetical protein